MFKKMVAYQRLISGMQGASAGLGFKVIPISIVFAISILVHGIIGFRYSFGVYLFFAAMVIGQYQLTNVRSSLCRNMPVSDSFTVINCMIVQPIWFCGLTFLIISGLGICLYLIENLGIARWAEGILMAWYDMLSIRGTINIWGCVFCILFAAVNWFVFCITTFSRNKQFKITLRLVMIVLYIILEYVMVKRARQLGYHGALMLSYIEELFPIVPLLVIMGILVVVCGIICYRYGIYKLRYDIKGQCEATINEAKQIRIYNDYAKRNVRGGKEYSKRTILMLVILGCTAACVLVSLMMLGVLEPSSDEHYDVKTTSIEQYEDWKNQDLFDGYFVEVGTVIFPEKVDKENVVSYKASKFGEQRGGLEMYELQRILIQKFSEEKFEDERKRLANISYVSSFCDTEGQVNYMIHDTDHFSHEAYIARFDRAQKVYEYAILNEKDKEIIYIYCNGINPAHEYEGRIIFPKWNSRVISIEQANTDYKGYNITSFD